MAAITRERAERIGKSHACTHCKEYSFKKLVVKPALDQASEDGLAADLVVDHETFETAPIAIRRAIQRLDDVAALTQRSQARLQVGGNPPLLPIRHRQADPLQDLHASE